jgi:hypothetical protein
MLLLIWVCKEGSVGVVGGEGLPALRGVGVVRVEKKGGFRSLGFRN